MNYIRILSKSSLVTSSSSVKSLTSFEEVTKLQTKIEKLKQTVESLKITVKGRDAAIGALAREKEKLYIELKSAQRTNRNLQQQLEDERDIHSMEKEYFIEEIKRITSKHVSDSKHNLYNKIGDTINNTLRAEIRSKDKVIFNICAKYLKIKKSKMLLLREFQSLQNESQRTCENLIMVLEDSKNEFDNLLRKLVEYSNVPPDTKNYFTILRHNANLYYENTQLKVQLTSSLHQNCVRDKDLTEDDQQKNMSKKQNVNAFVFQKSNERKKHHNKCCFYSILNSCSPNLIIKSKSDTCLALLRKWSMTRTH